MKTAPPSLDRAIGRGGGREEAPERARVTLAQLALIMRAGGGTAAVHLTRFVAALVTAGFVWLAVRTAHRDGAASLADVVALSSTVLAWSAGLLLVVVTVPPRLAPEGTRAARALLRLHGESDAQNARIRALGLGLALVFLVGGGSFLVALAGAVASGRRGLVLDAGRGLLGALVYTLGFALVIAPLAVATLEGAEPASARDEPLGAPNRHGSRAVRWSWLLLAWLVPALIQSSPALVRDPSWRAVVSLPSALAALRAFVVGRGDGLLAAHAATVLAGTVAVALVVLVSVSTPRHRGRAS